MSTTKIEFELDEATYRAFVQRTKDHALSPQAVAQAMLHQVAFFAPPMVVSAIAGQRGAPADLWAEFGQHVRNEYRRELAPELELAEAVRTVVAKRPNN